jgi:hypothetical protein
MLVIDFYYHMVLYIVCTKMGRHADTVHSSKIIFNVHIEQNRADMRTLVNYVLQVEALISTPKVQSILHVL